MSALAASAAAQTSPPVAGDTVGHENPVVLRPGTTMGMANDYRVQVRLANRGTLIYAPGRYTQSIHVGGDYGFTSAEATARDVVWPPSVALDGASGEWAWGKAMFLVSGAQANTASTFRTTATLRGFLVENTGNKEAPSSGTSGAMAERGGTLYVRDSDFENNANGIGAYEGADLVDVRDTGFSLTRGNGAADGKSHDAYVSAARNIFVHVIDGGLGTGNDIKIRGPYGRIDQSFLAASTGRWLDAPWGGDMVVSNSVLVQRPHADSDNMFGYAEEGSNNIRPGVPQSGRMLYVNDLIVVTRYGTDLFINDGRMEFAHCKWLFVQTDDTPPTLKVYASNGHPGAVVGLPYRVGSGGMLQMPDSAILHDISAIPPTPRDPRDLPALLAKWLPGPIVQMP